MKEAIKDLESVINMNLRRLAKHYNKRLFSVLKDYMKAYHRNEFMYMRKTGDPYMSMEELNDMSFHCLLVLNRLYIMKSKRYKK